eukprot:TRINITY_DN14582_c0_g1_i1.p1 TRINITY_DN14582_c0_g1~~TRINITY_DN14582_c0_g1_i1.p1  ORF type:complete len:118 (+),score=23.74 TRINITY_DN14582_c0_g1_i1:278-631(+)
MGLFSWAARAWNDFTGGYRSDDDDDDDNEFEVAPVQQPMFAASMLVFERPSEAFYDQDGIYGHEFYVESTDGHTMQRVTSGLRPVGKEPLAKATIHPSYPILLCTHRDLVTAGLLPQ